MKIYIKRNKWGWVTFIDEVCLGPITEEFLFRNLIFQCTLVLSKSLLFTILISATLFSFAHFIEKNFELKLFIFYIIIGICWGIIFYLSGSIFLVIFIHMTWNFFMNLGYAKALGVTL